MVASDVHSVQIGTTGASLSFMRFLVTMLVQAGRASAGRASAGQLAAIQVVACTAVLLLDPQVVAEASVLTGANAALHRVYRQQGEEL